MSNTTISIQKIYMKYLLIIVMSCVISNAQIKKEELNLMPWPQNISLVDGFFTLDKAFKINIIGNPSDRIFVGATNFLRRLDGRTGLFFEQGFLTKVNENSNAQLQINCSNKGHVALVSSKSPV